MFLEKLMGCLVALVVLIALGIIVTHAPIWVTAIIVIFIVIGIL
jgi:hypothetical protein